jgi:hypothetical protein
MCIVRVGGEQNEFLAITVLDRLLPRCDDFWDGNWLCAEVEVAAGGFRGWVSDELRAEELAEFHTQLARLVETLSGEAVFTTLEGWFSLRIVGDGRGHITLAGEISDQPGVGNTLAFRLDLDQTFLQPMIAQLGRAVSEYPVVGQAP